MTVGKCGKTVAYAVATLLVIGFSVWTVGPMYSSDEIVTAYLRSELLLLLAGCGLSGVGAYSFFAYTKRHREHRADSWFLAACGGAILLLAIVTLCRFGGMTEQNFSETSLAAVNLNIMLASALPLPFLVRAVILACGVEQTRKRLIGWVAVAVAAALFITLAACGVLLRTVDFPINLSQGATIHI